MNKKTPEFNYELCVSCGICAQNCPNSCLSLSRHLTIGKYKNVFPEITGGGCIGCGICSKACPMSAVTMAEAAHAD